MQCLGGFHHLRMPSRRPPLPSSLSPSPPPFAVAFLPAVPAPSCRSHLSLRASGVPPSNAPPSRRWESSDGALVGAALTLSFSLLKPICAALAVGAALCFARLHKPSPALAVASQYENLPSPSTATTLVDEEKERTLEDYLDAHPDDTGSLRALMKLKIKARKLPEAIAIVDRLVLLEPGDRGLPLVKAHLQCYGGDAETAQQVFEEMLRKDPLFVEAYHGLVMTASQSEPQEGDLGGILERIECAMELCKKERRKEELRDFKLLVAQVKVIQGNYWEALQVYQDLVKEEPRDFRPYLCQGIIYTLLRKKDEAEKQFQKYRRLVPRGHPYAQYLDENMVAMNAFPQMAVNTRSASLKR
uniref:Anaphase-promoting complex subunit CDC27 n=1 Tax=Anthurium amnicola TaxID=1678845 RepID=A0A1D1XND8_9ARAE